MFTTILALLSGVLIYTVTDTIPGFHPVWSIVDGIAADYQFDSAETFQYDQSDDSGMYD